MRSSGHGLKVRTNMSCTRTREHRQGRTRGRFITTGYLVIVDSRSLLGLNPFYVPSSTSIYYLFARASNASLTYTPLRSRQPHFLFCQFLSILAATTTTMYFNPFCNGTASNFSSPHSSGSSCMYEYHCIYTRKSLYEISQVFPSLSRLVVKTRV